MSLTKLAFSPANISLLRSRRNALCPSLNAPRSTSLRRNQSPIDGYITIRHQLTRHAASTASQPASQPETSSPDATSPANPQPTPPRARPRILRYTLLALLTFTLGLTMSAAPAIQTILEASSPPTDAETLTLWTPDPSSLSAHLDANLQSHPYVQSLLKDPRYIPQRPHLKIPASLRPQNLTGGTLLGPDKLEFPPLAFATADGSEYISFSYLGPALCGHPGIVHGGMSATLLDEGLARCCFPALPNKVGVTASLKIEYKRPVMSGQVVVMRARTTKVEGRKAWVVGRLETVPGLRPEELERKEGEEVKEVVNGITAMGKATGAANEVVNGHKEVNGVEEKPWEERGAGGEVLVMAEALFIEPRQAASMKRLYAS